MEVQAPEPAPYVSDESGVNEMAVISHEVDIETETKNVCFHLGGIWFEED